MVDSTGRVIGLYEDANIPVIGYVPGTAVGDEIDLELNERFMSVLSTKENVNLSMLGFEDNYEHYDAIIIPIDISGERLGTVFLYRLNNSYDIDDIILCEYATTIAAVELLHGAYQENQGDSWQEAIAKSAARSLSGCEITAAYWVFHELGGTQGTLVTSRLAEKYGLTRSVVVNAIKKLGSAGVIKSRSLGTKGTWIELNNRYISDIVEKLHDSRL
jgi:transcriptional pleiotropic repressor